MVDWAWWQWVLFVWGVSSVGGLVGFFTCAMLTVAKQADAHIEIIAAQEQAKAAATDASEVPPPPPPYSYDERQPAS